MAARTRLASAYPPVTNVAHGPKLACDGVIGRGDSITNHAPPQNPANHIL